jgi:hypothetical protein
VGDHVVQLPGDPRLLVAGRAPRSLLDRPPAVARRLPERPRAGGEHHGEHGVVDRGGEEVHGRQAQQRGQAEKRHTRRARRRQRADGEQSRDRDHHLRHDQLEAEPARQHHGHHQLRALAAPVQGGALDEGEGVAGPPREVDSRPRRLLLPHDEQEEDGDPPRDQGAAEAPQAGSHWTAHAPDRRGCLSSAHRSQV